MSKKIIIACDNEHICDFIENYAEKEGFTVKTICDISEDTQHVVRDCSSPRYYNTRRLLS